MPDSVGGTHHVKIGDQFFLIRPFSYQKRAAPLFGARITTGDPDYNNLSIWQHWAQSCWVGGMDADQWVDDAMFDDAVGIDSTQHERINLSRDLALATGGSLDAASLGEPRRFFIWRQANASTNPAYLYSLSMPRFGATSTSLWRYDGATWAVSKTWANKRARSFALFGSNVVVGFDDGTLQYTANPAGAWTSVDPPAGVTGELTALGVYKGKLYCAYLGKVYRRGTDFTVDGSTVFYEAEDVDRLIAMTVHLGYLYMLSRNGKVHRSDGNASVSMFGWDSNTIGTSMMSFDGRLFVATYEFTDGDEIGFGVLYQATGSAVTQLKRYGAVGRATTIGQLMVYDRRLWYGASGLWGMNKNAAGTDLGGFGVASYDPVEDAHSIWATNKDTVTYPDGGSMVGQWWHVDDVMFFQGKMHVAQRKYGNFVADISYRDYMRDRAVYDTTTTAATGAANNGFLTSSDYDAGTIGLQKMWRQIVVHGDLADDGCTVGVDYSLDGGKTWLNAGTLSRILAGTVSRTSGQFGLVGSGTKFLTELRAGESILVGADTRTVQSITSDTALIVSSAWSQTGSGAPIKSAATRFARRFPLQNVRGNRFKYRLRLNTSTASRSPVVRGVVVSYLPLPEPNWMWEFHIICSKKQQLLDGTVRNNVDSKAAMEYVDNLYRTQNLFTFTDIDGTVWTAGGPGCLLYDYTRISEVTGDTAAAGLEGTLRVVVLEAAESY